MRGVTELSTCPRQSEGALISGMPCSKGITWCIALAESFFWCDTWWVSAGYHGKKWEAKCQPSGHFTFQNTIMLDKVPSRYTRNFLPVLHDSREHEGREVQTCFLSIDTIQASWKLTNVIERKGDCNTYYYRKNNLHVHFLSNGSKPHM